MSSESLEIGFIPAGAPGGSGTGSVYTSTLLIEELSKNHNVHVYYVNQEENDPDQLPARDRVTYTQLPYNRFPHPSINRRRAISTIVDELESYDVVHSYSCEFVPELSGLETPVIVTLNSYLPVCPKDSLLYYDGSRCSGPSNTKCVNCIVSSQDFVNNPLKSLKSFYYQSASLPRVKKSIHQKDSIDAYHCLAPHLEEIYDDLGFDSEKLITIPHYFDERFQSDATPINDPVRLLYVGKLANKKGVQILPTALKQAKFDFELLVAGNGSQREALEREFSEVGLGNQVRFLGYVDYEDLPLVYEQSDIFLYPGQWPEPFGRVILEAMASKTPIISSDVGSMEWIIQDAGVVIPVEKFVDELVPQLEGIMNKYQSYIRDCDERIQDFKKDRVIRQFEELYCRLS